ncbi:30S ribosomal protein S20 [Numidum massiliense]|uniref:30S ribosomal protein S20 n=1 Tax=Numidum massiliense TaxID=1522315 RepID=UPI0006D57786|nr:30S ribosomal protein S20 [Numidum massiliense]
MPNIKSAIKRVKTNEKIRALQTSQKSALRSSIKSFQQTLENGSAEEAKAALVKTQKQLNQAAAKGLIHKNAAARKLSRLAKQLNNAQ